MTNAEFIRSMLGDHEAAKTPIWKSGESVEEKQP